MLGWANLLQRAIWGAEPKPMGRNLVEKIQSQIFEADTRLWTNISIGFTDSAFGDVGLLSLFPFAAMYVLESPIVLGLDHSPLWNGIDPLYQEYTSARNYAKMLDDDKLTIREAIQSAIRIAESERHYFNSRHSTMRDLWKRPLVTDLGLIWTENRLIATSHSMRSSFAKSRPEELHYADQATLASEVGKVLGMYLRMVFDHWRIDPQSIVRVSIPPEIRFANVKSENFLKESGTRISKNIPDVALFCLSILARLNAANTLVPTATQDNELALLKLRVVVLYHARSTITKMLAVNRESCYLTPDAESVLSDLLAQGATKRNKQLRNLRNAFVHYVIEPEFASRLDPDLPYLGLVEAHCPGTTAGELFDEVKLTLTSLSDSLQGLLFTRLPRTKLL